MGERAATGPSGRLEQIGRFRVVSILGEGAMGVVYQAFDPVIHREVAIKLVRSDLLEGADREDYLDRFRHEVRIAGQFGHPNIIAVHDFAMHGDNPYIVMEHVEGGPLNHAYPRGVRAAVADSVRIGEQMLSALQYAHGRGVVHRDVKPANVLLFRGLNVKVTDFGISRLVSSDTTVDHLMIGTPSYMSPEQARGEPVDPRSDLFSLGSVLYELLAGVPPFSGRDYNGTLHRLMHLPHEPLSRYRDDIPPELAALLDRALQKHPDDRFPDAAAFADALRRVPYPDTDWSGWSPPAARPATAPDDDDDASAATLVVARPPPSLRGEAPPPAREPSLRMAAPDAPAAPPLPVVAVDPPAPDPERVRRALAFVIGPIAAKVVERAAGCATQPELVAACAARIPDETGRRLFHDRLAADTATPR